MVSLAFFSLNTLPHTSATYPSLTSCIFSLLNIKKTAFLNWHSNNVYQYYSYIVVVELGVPVIDLEFAHTLSKHNRNALLIGSQHTYAWRV